MSNEQPHINPWADKLQQAPLPEADASWKGMEHLLDQHMPVAEKEKKRRFLFILFPVLFLLIGAGLLIGHLNNTPQQHTEEAAGKSKASTSAPGTATSVVHDSKSLPAVEGTTEQKRPNASTADTIVSGYAESRHSPSRSDAMDGHNETVHRSNGKELSDVESRSTYSSNTTDAVSATADALSGASAMKKANSDKQPEVAEAATNGVASTTKRKKGVRSSTQLHTRATVAANERTKENHKVTVAAAHSNDSLALDMVDAINSHITRGHLLPPFRGLVTPTQQLVVKDSIGLLRGSAWSDSVLQALKKKKSEEQKKGWTFSVGVNHFMRINSQQPAPYKGGSQTANSEGLTGKLADYLPVPQARYYFNNRLFTQGELQFNAPQFTQPVQLEQRSYRDGIFEVGDTAYLKKLTYFNLPLSVHYRPIKRVYIGAGVQFSGLTNAIVLYEKTRATASPQLPDSTMKISKQQRIKGDTLSQKFHTSELRLLGDVSYQAGPFSLGLRYNHALRGLVKVPVASAAFTQTRNSSLQLFIRYRFLDKRKRIQPRSK